MPIKIGERTLPTTRPADLDGLLVEQTGCTAAEHRQMLAKMGTPFQIARALRPFLADDAASVGDVAAMITDDDALAVRAQVLELLAPLDAAPAVPAPVAGA